MLGKVVVRQGQSVEAKDVIAEAIVAPEHILIDVTRALNVSEQKADSVIQRDAGETVEKGDLIAGPVGLTQRVVRAPSSGQIVIAGGGQVLMQVSNKPYEILAGMTGTITNLIPDRGAVIETIGALVQGIWGNGRMDFGLMQSKLEAPDAQLDPDVLDVSLRGAIILGGHCNSPKVLQKGAEIPLRGLILTSMDAALIPLAQEMEYPIIVLEGFGPHALNAISYNVLTTNQNRELSINAEPVDLFHGKRPEIVIPLDAAEEPEDSTALMEDFAPGHKVRIVRQPHAGRIATIESVYSEPVSFPSGVRALGAQVVLGNKERVTIPLANLEIVR
jgi:hypothetical protein